MFFFPFLFFLSGQQKMKQQESELHIWNIGRRVHIKVRGKAEMLKVNRNAGIFHRASGMQSNQEALWWIALSSNHNTRLRLTSAFLLCVCSDYESPPFLSFSSFFSVSHKSVTNRRQRLFGSSVLFSTELGHSVGVGLLNHYLPAEGYVLERYRAITHIASISASRHMRAYAPTQTQTHRV